MEDYFKITDQDTGFSLFTKRESNAYLASLPYLSGEYNEACDRFGDLLHVANAIDSCEFLYDEQIHQMFEDLTNVYNGYPLSPLKLDDEEFDLDGYNKRYHWLHRISDSIINKNAYKVKIQHIYNDDTKTEILDLPEQFNNFDVDLQPNLYINKGGVITGDIILKPCIKDAYIKSHKYTIKKPIEIPVSIIFTTKDPITGETLKKPDGYCVVDHRHPTLNELMTEYSVTTGISEAVKNLKLNIRNYKKLK